MIPRLVQNLILEAQKQFPGRAILLFGARQVGKTTLLKEMMRKYKEQGKKNLYFNCDLAEDKDQIDTNSLTVLKKRLDGIDAIFIDEAQRLTNAGLTIKIIADNYPRIKLIATGSSAFELKNKLSDAMTGRYLDFPLYPLGIKELIEKTAEADYLVDEILRFGTYPAVYLSKKAKDKITLLDNIVESYLFKDIFEFNQVRNFDTVKNLCRALAYQLGAEVNENELANRLSIDRKTVRSYLNFLEQSFIIFKLRPFSNNLRREIGRNFKIYFLDLGIRNALIGDFKELKVRSDAGALWENFLIMERLKKNVFGEKLAESFFWRTYGGAEIDYVEKSKIDSGLTAFEFKLDRGKLNRSAESFHLLYKTSVKLINRQNFSEFIL